MPTYDYRCEATGEVFEVKHPMALSVKTWGELSEVGGFDLGNIAPDSPVSKVLSTGGVVNSSSLKNPNLPPCMTGGGCSGGFCGA